MTGRPASPGRRPMPDAARRAAARRARAEVAARAAAARAAEATRELAAIHAAAEARFGKLPADPLLLDVLALVDVEPGGAWRWRGMRNNQGLGTIRSPGGTHPERSVVRYLAEAFGVVGPDDHGSLYPTAGDPDDVNPWHRTLRRTAAPAARPSHWPGRQTSSPER